MNIDLLVGVNTFGIISLVFLIYLVSTNVVFNKRWIKAFKVAIAINVLMLVFDIIQYLTSYNYLTGEESTIYVIGICFMLNPTLPLFLIAMLNKTKAAKQITITSGIVNAAIVWTMLGLYIASGNETYFLIARVVQAVISLFAFLFLIIITLYRVKIVGGREPGFFLIIIFAVLIGYVLETASQMRFVVWNLSAICMLLYYMFITTQYLKNDILTGLSNRYVFEKDIRSNKENSLIIVFDINNLKMINDTLGHRAGDKLIEEVATQMKIVFPGGKSYRIGGDEFVHIQEAISEEECNKLLDKFTSSLANKNSISCGYAYSDENVDIIKAFSKADNNMYINKAIMKELEKKNA